jgi:hypothetical protein
MVKPINTGAKAVPRSWLESSKSFIKTVSSCARIAKDTEVVINARQLVIKRRFLLIVSIAFQFKVNKKYPD